jgi:multidrug efflux pump subunit AcrB
MCSSASSPTATRRGQDHGAPRGADLDLLYVGLIAGTVWMFTNLPSGFLPEEDQGYFFIEVQLPDAASLTRTETALDRLEQQLLRSRASPT